MSRLIVYLDRTTEAEFNAWLSEYGYYKNFEQEPTTIFYSFEKGRLKVTIYQKLGVEKLPPVLNLLAAIAQKWRETRSDILKYAKAQERKYPIVMDTSHFPAAISYNIVNPAKYKEITFTVLLKDENSQKFNLWLKDCFYKLDEHYMLAAINSGIVYRFQKLAINEEYTSALIDPFYDNKSRMGMPIVLKWIEVGANLKVMITFPTDPRIINPLWDILLELCNDFPYLRGTVPHLVRDIRTKYQFEIPDIPIPLPVDPAPPVDTLGTESKSPKDKAGAKTRKKKRKAITLPTYYEDAKKWVLAWGVIEPLINDDPTLEIDYYNLLSYLKAKELGFGKETVKKIISWGRSKDVLTLLELDRKHNK